MRGYASPRAFQIKYYRDGIWTEKYERAGIYKPEGYAISPADPVTESEAREVARHINSQQPTYPCLVVKVA